MSITAHTKDIAHSITAIVASVGDSAVSAAGSLRETVSVNQGNPHARFDGTTHNSNSTDGVF